MSEQKIYERYAEQCEALGRETLRDDWLRGGGDPADFETDHKAISVKAKEERLAVMDLAAKESFSRQLLSGF